MEKQLNKISIAEMKKNMNRALMTDGKMLKAIYRQMMELGWI